MQVPSKSQEDEDWAPLPKANCYLLIGVFVPFVWSSLFGLVGWSLGTDKLHSPGMVFIGIALLPHIPLLVVASIVAPHLPMGAGEEGSFEVLLLVVLTVPSCLFYGFIGWVIGTDRDANESV